ncbi:hypothetical protein FGE12_24310 [Aggregicoccus sp. 17bor-14]|uniref:hypothetical protein n=1 Tax=Myxococcaceae TaxID=31 RepID=UPI00129C35FF|nr:MULTISPECIES: hypothetical protein [Myxococcaceae]MBF5045554.1 hypothetical protein [Simulacricoccus sp. 17bor-14]MRI91291.1 hypothetical protein [Aggregicoccus sp. 17bor-14]
MRPVKRPARAPRRSERGQAMLEYSVVTWFLVMALALGASVRIEWTDDVKGSVIELFLRSYQTYYDSYLFVLNLPIP